MAAHYYQSYFSPFNICISAFYTIYFFKQWSIYIIVFISAEFSLFKCEVQVPHFMLQHTVTPEFDIFLKVKFADLSETCVWWCIFKKSFC